MRSKGFTLVELLAVIVILAIILAIAVPTISNVINSSTKSTFESSAKLVLKGIEYKMLEDSTFDPTSITESNVGTSLNIDDSNYKSITVKKINDVLYITIVGQNKWDKYTVSGTKTITKVEDTVTSFTGGANKPVLADGMEAVVWSGEEWVEIDEDNPDWYNYDTTDKKWANARTADGSMWVWIPRYVYKISSGWHTSIVGTIDIQFSKGVDDNWNKSVIGAIDLREGAVASDAATNGNKYTNHPAFIFGDTELTGIWVAKFEASGTTAALDFKPNVLPLINQTIGTLFTAARNMETNTRYGWGATGNGIDTHMMKSSEWGAAAYLAQSTYGKNTEIWINNSNSTTGCAGNSASDAGYNGCQNTYDTDYGKQSSTTGNIYGIYDMSGGVWEYVASYIDNGDSNLMTYGNNILDADIKYKEVYAKISTDSELSNYDLAINKKGDVIYEISATGSGATSWNDDYSSMPRVSQPWLFLGGPYYDGTSSGAFAFYFYHGGANSAVGFRPTLLVDQGL